MKLVTVHSLVDQKVHSVKTQEHVETPGVTKVLGPVYITREALKELGPCTRVRITVEAVN
jgi:hypothetical protein